jgi:hypothetical protein
MKDETEGILAAIDALERRVRETPPAVSAAGLGAIVRDLDGATVRLSDIIKGHAVLGQLEDVRARLEEIRRAMLADEPPSEEGGGAP